MTESVLIGVVGLKNSKKIWDTLESNFASQSRDKLMQIKYQLQTLRKGNLSMLAYLNKVNSYCNILASAGKKVSDKNHILHILAGLGPEYNPVIVSITSRVEHFSLRDVKSMLLVYESRLEHVEQPSLNTDGSTPTANMATQTQQPHNLQIENRGRGSGSNQGRGYGYGRGGRDRGNQGRGGRFNNNWKPRCQICRIIGHTADNCHERTNLNFVPNVITNNRGNGHGNFERQYHFNNNSSGGGFVGSNYGGTATTYMASVNGS
ncbi:hypothetical protein C2S52_012999 [Perilla frutescens var. hirtella]|nr:hypothetical protein C2S52_012999 [Perilla frutescens var. hirtella]